MEEKKITLKDLFEFLFDKENKRFFENYVLLTCDDRNYSCALIDESVRYGTDNYELFEQAIRKEFPEDEANQILQYEMSFMEGIPSYIPFDKTIVYYSTHPKTKKQEKKTLHVNTYPKNEFEDTKMYKSGGCGFGNLFDY